MDPRSHLQFPLLIDLELGGGVQSARALTNLIGKPWKLADIIDWKGSPGVN